ncbi:MAG: LicD family protein [Candidatus Borkfalkiaceae bacterium]|nr:LicD family protein [Clostridia bacterium]MDY6223589.1 LicD family protein [Christensenellaceae bacterium]
MNERFIDLKQLKKIECNLLKQVDGICRENGFRYSLGGGTLLGAVRHKGFIPWDDDIDIMMPRPDYNAFIAYCREREVPFGVKCWETDRSYVDFSAKIYDKNTEIKEDNVTGTEATGVSIDVFPVDGLGNTRREAVKAFKATAFRRELLGAAQWKKFFRSKTHAWYLEPVRFAIFIMSRFINKEKTFAKILKKYETIDFNNVRFAAAVGGSYREKEILPQNVFTSFIELPFEEYTFRAIAACDTYLTSLYGDYMKLPPEEKRVSHHMFKACYKDNAASETTEKEEI